MQFESKTLTAKEIVAQSLGSASARADYSRPFLFKDFHMTETLMIVGGVIIGVLFVIPLIVSSFLRNVEAGTIRMVSWLQGSTIIYRGPGKSKEVPLLT